MPTPTYLQWRTGQGPGLSPAEIKLRQLMALATIVTGKNPDGTLKGS